MKNLIEILLLQIGEQLINKEAAMKSLQSLTVFFGQYSRKTEKKLVSKIRKNYFRKTLGDKINSTFSCRETSLNQ